MYIKETNQERIWPIEGIRELIKYIDIEYKGEVSNLEPMNSSNLFAI